MRLFVLTGALAAALICAPAANAQEGIVVHPEWTRTPKPDEMRRLYPRQARGETGQVRAICLIDDKGAFSSCEITSETPPERGFGESTLKLSKLFRMKLTDGDGQPVAGRKLHLPVTWYGAFYN